MLCIEYHTICQHKSFLTVTFFLLTEVSGIHDVKLYNYKELRIATEEFSPANKIGEGGFGLVYKVTTDLLFYMCCESPFFHN